MSRTSPSLRNPPRTSSKKQRPPEARVYSSVEDVSWHSIARDTWFPGIGNDYSSTFSLDPEEGQCTPVARWLRDKRPGLGAEEDAEEEEEEEDPHDVSPPSYVQPGPPLVLKQDARVRLRERFRARCDSPTPSEDTLVRLNRQDDTTPSYASGAASPAATPDTTRSSVGGGGGGSVTRTRPKNPSPPPSPTVVVATARGGGPRAVRPVGPSSRPSTVEATPARRGETPRVKPGVPSASRDGVEVATRGMMPRARPGGPSRRADGSSGARAPEKSWELWGPGLPYLADFLSNEPVLTRGGLRYQSRCPRDWYEG